MSYRGKVILLGDAGVGKTSLLARYVDDIFRSEYIATIGANFLIKEVNLNTIIDKLDNPDIQKSLIDKNFKLYFWDIGGQPDKLFVTEYYFIQAIGAMVIFNVDNIESFNNLDFWISKLKELSGPDIPFNIIGNKIDLEEERIIQSKEIEKKAIKYGIPYFETSAKLNTNVDSAFDDLSIQILNKLK